MPQVAAIGPNSINRILKKAIRLIVRHRDGHITREGFEKFCALTPTALEQPGTAVIVALQGGRIAGVLACGDQGRDFSIVVVHKAFRGQGLAKAMLKKAIEVCGGFYCEVASDNYPSLKTCFANGLVAYDAFLRRNKIVLRFKYPANADAESEPAVQESH